MKQPLIQYRLLIGTIVLMFATTILCAQGTGDQLYGFSRVTTPGIAPADKIENLDGSVTERKVSNNTNYLIYLRTAAKTRVYPIEIWINGEVYSARPETVTKTPVQVAGPTVMGRTQQITLVPKTTQKVTQLIPTPLMADKSSAKARKLAQTAELVVVYKQGGKTFYKTLKTLKALPVNALQ